MTRRWRIVLALSAAALVLATAALAILDPITRFSIWLSYYKVANPMYFTGLSGEVDLPPTASAEDVAREEFKSALSRIQILQVGRVYILGSTTPHWAALIQHKEGQEMLLMSYINGPGTLHPGTTGYWMTKPYPVPGTTPRALYGGSAVP